LTDGLSGHVRRPRKPPIRDRVQRPADDVAILRHQTLKVLGQIRRTQLKPNEKGRRRTHPRSVVDNRNKTNGGWRSVVRPSSRASAASRGGVGRARQAHESEELTELIRELCAAVVERVLDEPEDDPEHCVADRRLAEGSPVGGELRQLLAGP
jgi:hypothetical protein